MTPHYEHGGVTVYHGDVMGALRSLPDCSVDCCVTSPPYWGLRDYGIPDQIWGGEQGHRHVWGDRYVSATNHTDKRRWNHAVNGRGEEQPVEKQVATARSDVAQGSFCECGAWRGSLGLEPSPELFVEHIVSVFDEVRRVLRPDGTCWLNLGDTYHNADKWGGGGANTGKHTKDDSGDVPSWKAVRRKWAAVDGLKPKDLVGIPWRCAFALQEAGWWLRSDIIWSKPAPMPESVTDRPTRSHEYIFLLAKSVKYYYDAAAIAESAISTELKKFTDGGTDKQRGHGRRHAGFNGRYAESLKANGVPQTRNKRDVWTISTAPFPSAHFATFPPALIRPCILAGCPPNGTVLDPFFGAGTTGLVAKENGRKCIGVELNAEYIEIAAKRLSQEVLPLEATA